jgi:hypothetical protein
MTRLRTTVALLSALALASPLRAFHDGGVANCGGCHTTHNSADGSPVLPGPGNDYSLLAESPSDVCLRCHAQSLGSVLGQNPLAPPPEKGAGNFVFLYEDELNDATGEAPAPIPGDAAGHSLVAPAHGLAGDLRFTVAPGGSFPASELGCTSCHDPHGRDTFRLLHGVGTVQNGVATFVYAAPRAAGIGLGAGESEQRDRHTAYRGGMSDWCANCHSRYHDGTGGDFEHPIDGPFGVAERDQYNSYDGADSPVPGSQATAYLPEVPFEDASATIDSRSGPSATSRLMCLSCHRAHATSAPHAGRWDFAVDKLAADGVASGSWAIPSPYPSPEQPGLCFKCHLVGTGTSE